MTTTLERFADPDGLADEVARRLLERLADAQSGGASPHVALTGGSIAEAVHRALARLSPGSGVDWTRVEVWWGDERFVAPDDAERNAGQARRAFLDAVGVPPERVHEMPSTAGAADVEAAAAAYSDELRHHGSGEFEVVMLGIGPDGHVASLFPGHAALEVDDRVAVGVTGSPKPPPERVSLTFGALNRARSVWFVAAGAGKSDAVARALAGAPVHEVPACGVTGRDETVWFVDDLAAGGLTG